MARMENETNNLIKRVDDEQLEEFISGFYGHGNLQGNCWFIGMEHGGGSSYENIKRRIDQWVALEKQPAIDLVDYCIGINESHYFNKPVKNQPTWNKLIRLLLSLHGDGLITLKKVKTYQMHHWGRHDGDTALLELLPLPNPSLKQWLYGIYSGLPYLKDRETYREYVLPRRIDRLKQMMTEYKPRFVHFYGKSYKKWWRQIAGVSFESTNLGNHSFDYGKSKDTVFLMTSHPVATGITVKYFEEIGQFLRPFLCTQINADKVAKKISVHPR